MGILTREVCICSALGPTEGLVGFLTSSSGSMGAPGSVMLGGGTTQLQFCGCNSPVFPFLFSPPLALFSMGTRAAFYAVLCGSEVGDLVYLPRTEPL